MMMPPAADRQTEPRPPVAWCDGRIVPAASCLLPVGDAGFVLGATVTEQLRTFRGVPFLPGPHAARLEASLAALSIEPRWPTAEIFAAVADVAARNHSCVAADDDLGIVVFVTPGDLPAQHGGTGGPARTVVHSFPLAFPLWADAYETGVALRTVATRQVPDACWPLSAKVRSRLHYYLADREASAAEPHAKAVLEHLDGRVSETSTANVAMVRRGAILTPPPTDALPGVSLGHVRLLAESLGLPWEARSLTAADLATADEILLTSTPSCLLPATRLNGRPVGDGRPGATFRRLLEAWSRAIGVDIAAQARSRASACVP
jgi:branched-subunit amino acid aminotransferase/4-amino-4-deoxychorismate lyase